MKVSDKIWAVVGQAFVFLLSLYILFWLLTATIGTLIAGPESVAGVDNAFIECRVVYRIPVIPPIVGVAGAKMEICEQWAKEHP